MAETANTPDVQPVTKPEGYGADGKYLTINVLSRRAKQLARKHSIGSAQEIDPVEEAAREMKDEKLIIRNRNAKTNEIEEFAWER